MDRKTVIVMGAANYGNIGAAVVQALHAGKYNVAAVDNQNGSLMQVPPNGVKTYLADCADWDSMMAIFWQVQQEYGDIHGLVNCMGVNVLGSLDGYTMGQFEHTLRNNLLAPFICIKAFVATCGNQFGTKMIVNIGSNAADIPRTKTFAYAASKRGLQALTQCLARELAPRRFSVIQLDLGVVEDTPMDKLVNTCLVEQRGSTIEEWKKMRRALVPANRFASTREVAWVILSLLERGAYLSGSCIRMDGAEQAGTFWAGDRE